MSRKSLRIFMCAAVATALGTFGTATQATFYGGLFDPPEILGHFTGSFLLDVSDTCNPDSCQIDLVSLTVDDSGTFGTGWFSSGQTDIASNVSFVGGLHFLSELIPLSNFSTDLFSAAFGSSRPPAICNTPSLMFTPDLGDDSFQHHGFIANLGCFDSGNQFIAGDNAVYRATVVPEPDTLGLLVGGIGAAWLARRRKTTA